MTDLSIEIFTENDFIKLAELFFRAFAGDMPDTDRVKMFAKHIRNKSKKNIVDFYIVKEKANPIGLGGISKFIGT